MPRRGLVPAGGPRPGGDRRLSPANPVLRAPSALHRLRGPLRGLVAACALAAGAAAQSEGESRTPLPRERYGLARPVTAERFRSVFGSFDMDGDGRITRREARALGMVEARYEALDWNHDGFITNDEWDLTYAREVRARGCELDEKLAGRVAELERVARARGWKPPEIPSRAPSESSTPAPPARPSSQPGSAARARYRAATAAAEPKDEGAGVASRPASAPAVRPSTVTPPARDPSPPAVRPQAPAPARPQPVAPAPPRREVAETPRLPAGQRTP